MNFKKIFCRFAMTIIIVAPYYDFFMDYFPDIADDRYNIGYFIAQTSMLVLPLISSLLYKDNRTRISYIFICYTIIAVGDYLHALAYGIFFEISMRSSINLLAVNSILKITIAILKIVVGNTIFSKTLDKSLYSE